MTVDLNTSPVMATQRVLVAFVA